ncbi:VOC family protein [Spirosoma sp. KNUC1025]|uniref:VOC family protein n=1 Tax=Spirosoma sp. KNUC1025 TaxID=2894082 RepID=UPI003867F3B3|nr:VOC family protein [Spirosoma sp. KNUC1025]
MTQINAYLGFNGNCCEAMTFYKECLGGALTLQTIGESPMGEQAPKEVHQQILHAYLQKGPLLLMGSDMPGTSLVAGNSVTLALMCSTEDEIKTFFGKLSEDGQIKDPLADTFWGAIYGSLVDKFGINWLLNYDKNQN